MEKIDIQKLRDLPIEGVAERLGLKVARHKSLCPFHDDSKPSLTFNVRKNTYKCYVCDAHGGPIDLVMGFLNKSFIEACRWLADEHNIILTEYLPRHSTLVTPPSYPPDVAFLSTLVQHPHLNAEARHFLFDQRKYSPKVVEWLGISSISHPTPCWRYGKPFYDAPSLLIPYKDADGSVQNVQSRYLGNDKQKPRFRFPRNSNIHIFNLPIIKYLKEGEPLFVSEGITDCIALLSSGHKAIAIPSATLLKPKDLQNLKTLNPKLSTLNLHCYPDNDVAGERLYIQLLHHANQIGACLTRHRLPEGCKDFSEHYINQNPES